MTSMAGELFEECRFILELLIAEHLFASALGRRQRNFWRKAIPGSCCLVALSCLYPFFIHGLSVYRTYAWFMAVNIGWYAMLAIGCMFTVRWCYSLSVSDTVYLSAAAYCLQHMEFVLVNEVIAKGIWVGISSYLPFYVAVCVVTTVGLYYIVYRIFRVRLSWQGGRILDDSPGNIAYAVMLYSLVIVATFMCQTIFVSGRYDYDQINYLGAVTDILLCVLILWVQFMLCRVHELTREKEVVEQLLYERKRQYELSRENISVINHKCHDLKHQIRALKEVDATERGHYLEELENSIGIYDAVLETGNEVLNTILSEKSLNCEQRQIKLSCIVDAGHLDFMSTLDIYALLGNALDNAIENVSKYRDEDKRVISLTIKTVGDFLSIQINNYCEEELTISDGLPVTTKKDRQYHGFGMKSMRHLARKYGGSLAVDVVDNVFTLQILIPMPKEFLRLHRCRQAAD